MSGSDAKAHYHLLRQEKQVIEQELGDGVVWRELPNNKQSYITVRQSGVDPTNKDTWPEQHDWMIEKLELFHKVFSPRVKKLKLRNWSCSIKYFLHVLKN